MHAFNRCIKVLLSVCALMSFVLDYAFGIEGCCESCRGGAGQIQQTFAPVVENYPLGQGFYLAKMIQKKDYVEYTTDSSDTSYQERQREEQEKVDKSWDMLKNIIIDTRGGEGPCPTCPKKEHGR